jgi:hypothetical protein
MPIRDAPGCQEKSRVPRETGSAVFCTVLVKKKKKKIQKKEDVYSEKLPEWGRGGKMLDPSCGRVRPEDRKKTSDFVSS